MPVVYTWKHKLVTHSSACNIHAGSDHAHVRDAVELSNGAPTFSEFTLVAGLSLSTAPGDYTHDSKVKPFRIAEDERRDLGVALERSILTIWELRHLLYRLLLLGSKV